MHLEHVARLGYVARGSIFLILGYFCAFAAYASTRPLDSNDAFRSLLTKPLGGILLGALAACLFCFAAWRLAQALFDVDGCGKDLPGCGKRIAYGFAGLFYVVFGLLALSVLFGLAHGNSDTIARDWSARLLSIPFGRWLVAAVGLTIIGIGIGTAIAGLRAEFAQRMSMPAESRRLIVLIGFSSTWFNSRSTFHHDRGLFPVCGLACQRQRSGRCRRDASDDPRPSLRHVPARNHSRWLGSLRCLWNCRGGVSSHSSSGARRTAVASCLTRRKRHW